MPHRRAFLSSLALLALSPLIGVTVARAGEAASDWSRDAKSGLRLISAGPLGEGQGLRYRGGVQITLSQGTKTYWRTPGDSGVPPAFDWSGSVNVAHVELAWPAPVRFVDGGGQSIGYKREVVFPILVTPKDPTRPVELAAKVDYAVCDNICIPAKGEAHIVLRPDAPREAELIALVDKFAARVPATSAKDLRLALVSLDRSGPHPVALLAAEVGADAGPADLFAEGPDGRWSLPLPEVVPGSGPERRFRLVLDGAPRGVDPLGQLLTFTLVTGRGALETALQVGAHATVSGNGVSTAPR
jgi:DsbC/DsbD-like thiol-disulfide interchange protein